MKYFHGFEAIGIGLFIASLAAGIACTFFLLPYVFIRASSRELNNMSGAAWVTGLPSAILPMIALPTMEPLLFLMTLSAVAFSFAGGAIFGSVFRFCYYRMMDSGKNGFFEENGSLFELKQPEMYESYE